MSYLDVPRLHFAGQFFADPSTANNTLGTCCLPGAARYPPGVPPIPITPDECSYNPGATSVSPAWNANGRHWFFFNGCTVKSVVDTGGSLLTTSGGDLLVGGAVETTNNPQIAKIVDLDPEFQTGSQIWGAEIEVTLSSGSGSFKGKMKTATLRDLYGRRAPGGFSKGLGGVYQSVLTGLTWDTSSTSPVFNRLRAMSVTKLSIKFVLYAYVHDSGTFMGKVVGTIGPSGYVAEPDHFVAKRRIDASGSVAWGSAPFQVSSSRNKVVIDLGNCVPEATPGGSRENHGTLEAKIMLQRPAADVTLGTLNYARAHYEQTAGIEEISITAAQAAQLAGNPVGIWRSNPSSQMVASERPNGVYVDAEQIVLRLNPGESEVIKLIATEFGGPKTGQIGLRLGGGGPPAGLEVNGSALTGPVNVAANAAVTFRGGNPGRPRPHIDGELYSVAFSWGPATPSNRRGWLKIRVYSSHTVPAAPTWADVRDILTEYARIYPFMGTHAVRIAHRSYYRTATARNLVKATIDLPETDPRYMPVTRDLSKGKRDTLIKWLNNGAP